MVWQHLSPVDILSLSQRHIQAIFAVAFQNMHFLKILKPALYTLSISFSSLPNQGYSHAWVLNLLHTYVSTLLFCLFKNLVISNITVIHVSFSTKLFFLRFCFDPFHYQCCSISLMDILSLIYLFCSICYFKWCYNGILTSPHAQVSCLSGGLCGNGTVAS